jgi:predicted HicB family RNase H-like nuclease
LTFNIFCDTIISMKGPGRPKKPKKERQSSFIAVRVQPHERKALEEQARQAGISLSALLRKKILDGLKPDG